MAESTPRLWDGRGPVVPEGLSHNDEDLSIQTLLAPAQGPGELGRLGNYRILSVLGMGGMGIVFKGEDPELKRIVALKGMLPTVAAKATNRQRFVREARATAAIRHDHIITVYNVGEDRGIPFLVMEFLEGEALDQRLAQHNTLPYDEVLRIGLETAEGLAAAHKCGMVHRDIKPANIWLEGERGRVKILDFGLARVTAEDSHLTLSGVILGTPAFMAPEQARGLPVGPESDLFSLGSVLYRMCTGDIPFQGPDTLAILTALATEEPRAIHLICPDIPPALASLIMSLLAKNPDERPATARAVVDSIKAIQRFQAGGDILDLDTTKVLLEGEVEPSIEESPEPLFTAKELPSAPYVALEDMPDLVGYTLGRYALDDVLGCGHHGVVFRPRPQQRRCRGPEDPVPRLSAQRQGDQAFQ